MITIVPKTSKLFGTQGGKMFKTDFHYSQGFAGGVNLKIL